MDKLNSNDWMASTHIHLSKIMNDYVKLKDVHILVFPYNCQIFKRYSEIVTRTSSSCCIQCNRNWKSGREYQNNVQQWIDLINDK